MFMLPGYVICEKIHESNSIKVYRGFTSGDETRVIIKATDKEPADPISLSCLLNEYEITRNLDIDGIVKPEKLEHTETHLALVMKDPEAVPLREYFQDFLPDLHKFLDIAIQLADTLGQLHQKGIIHGNLKPENILINTDTGKVYIKDFSSSLSLSQDKKNAPHPNNPMGTPEYMSPEQTGLLNMEVDHRSDIYSLGVILYETITGHLPLQAKTPAEWIHAHITQQPKSPDKINPDIPPVISRIIMKLLSKAADERYQSVYGLWWDFKECERLLKQTKRIDFFSIGQADSSASFRLPRNFYGRDKERKILKDAFKRVCEGKSELILVSGYPGIGKTRLINESLKLPAMEKGFFITGKCDQLMYNIPYAPFAEAFGNLIKQLMTKNKEELDKWRKRIMLALGRNGAVVTDIVPELEHIIGKQHPVDELPPKEAENRFLMVFRDFVKVFACNGHPLVVFLDDLQWADPACVRLVKYLSCEANISSLLFTGAFREKDVDGAHPLAEILKETQKGCQDKQHISLMPLEKEQVESLVAETLQTELNNVTDLSDVLYCQSGGNPLFLKQLIALIHDEELLYYDKLERSWKWELDEIRKLQPGEDVLELLLKKIQKLPKDTLEVLKLAACIGNRFDLETLAAVHGKSRKETVYCLMPAIREGLVLILEEQDIKVFSEYDEASLPVFEFLHDRVQQAAYFLITEDEKKEKHLAIGNLLLQNTKIGSLEDKILPAMDHFNRSLELIHDDDEKIRLAGYNLMAGQKAKALAAYTTALHYFRTGCKLLPDTAWVQAYKLSFDLYVELAQAEYLSSNVKTAEELFDIVLGKTSDELERATVYGLKVILYASMGNYSKAVYTGLKALENLGVRLPLHPTKLDYVRELLLFKWYMKNKRIGDLLYLPEAKDPVQRKIAELLTRLSSVTMTSYPDLFSLIILKGGNHAIRHGNTEMAPVGYLGYSITAGSILGDYKSRHEYGKLSIDLVEKYGRSSSKCIIYFVIGALISHWTLEVSYGTEFLKKAVITGMEAGDVLIIGYSHCILLEITYLLGVHLEEVAEEIRKKSEVARRLKHNTLANNVAVYEKVVSTLLGRNGDSLISGVAEYQKGGLPQSVQKDQSSLATYYIYEMTLCYMTENYRDALAAAHKIEPLIGAITGFLVSAEYYFYYSLVIAAIYDELSFRDKKFYYKILRKNQKQMKKWAENCKKNFEHKYLLVTAEIARIQGNNIEAMTLYDQAVCSARENGYVQTEALANELAAKFYLSQDLEKIARAYMQDACHGYNIWGAYAKVKELLVRYSSFLEKTVLERQKSDNIDRLDRILNVSPSDDSETAVSVDMYFLNRMIENISEETDISKLLQNFLDIAAQSIGADRGYLILEKDGDLFIEAVKDSNLHSAVVKTVPLEENHELSKAVVWYVARTLETIVLNCEEHAGIFAGDPYIAESSPKSLACLPLLFQGIPFGVLYFENRYIPGVFAPERLELLKLLSTQIAYINRIQSYLEKDGIKDEKKASFTFVEPLTERETEVLNLIAKGMSNKEIADTLKITINTVKGYIKNIYEKLGVNRRVQVVTKARELKLLKDD